MTALIPARVRALYWTVKTWQRGEKNNLTSIRLHSHKSFQIIWFFKIQETSGLWRRQNLHMTRRMIWNSSLLFWTSNLFNLIRRGMVSLSYLYVLQAKFEEPKNRNKGGKSNKWSADHTRTDGIFWFKYFSIFILLFVEMKSYLAVRIEKWQN